MGYRYYEILGLVAQDKVLVFSDVADDIKKRFVSVKRKPEVKVQAAAMQLIFGDWTLRIYWADGSHVLEESNEIAGLYAKGRPDASVIATCNRRIETSGDDDPGMVHFNDYVFMLNALESIEGIFIFDPQGQTFL